MIFSRNKFCFTGGYIETAVQLPGTNNVIGLWPAVWTMGNLGRAGYGASLEGMVRIFYTYLISRLNISLTYSGRIHMIVAMLEQPPIKPLTVCRTPQPLMEIISTTTRCPICRAKNFLAVRATESHIQAQSMLMGPTWVGLRQKSTC